MQTWEYLSVTLMIYGRHPGWISAHGEVIDLGKDMGIAEVLNKYGDQGWELISRQDDNYVFKRPKFPQAPPESSPE